MKPMKLAGKRVAIISHVYAPGPPHELEAYLKDKVGTLFFVGHPFPFMKNSPSQYRLYKNGQLTREWQSPVWRLPDLLLNLKDFVANLMLIGLGQRFDLIIALDNLNAASAIWLRALGRAKRAVFYSIDYIPKRFTSPMLNTIYHRLDNYCVRHADYIWNLSPVMTEMREKKGIEPIYRQRQLIVPIGTHLLPVDKVKKDPNRLVFMGHLRAGQGAELLLDAMPDILKERPKTTLRFIGSGPLEDDLRQRAKKLKIESAVEFCGFVPTNEEMRQLLLEGSVAVAPYVDDETTYTRYTDPGKPKEYLAAGLPVIITRVPQFAETIEREGAGKAINYDRQELAKAAVELLGSKQIEQYRDRALALARRHTWEKVFDQAFSQMAD